LIKSKRAKYTVWSRKRGAGRGIMTKSTGCTMATHFHIKWG